MDWLNEHIGLVVVITAVIIVLLVIVTICMLYSLRNKIAVQRPKFLNFYATDVDTRERYGQCIIGNRSLNEVGLAEIGIRNGKVSFDLTDLYKEKKNIAKDVRIVLEQRSSIQFVLTEEELTKLLVDGKNGKVLKSLYLYCVDLTGNLYKGKIRSVRRLLYEIANPLKKQTEMGGHLPPELKNPAAEEHEESAPQEHGEHEETPVEAAPVENAPAETTPAEAAPVETTPAQQEK